MARDSDQGVCEELLPISNDNLLVEQLLADVVEYFTSASETGDGTWTMSDGECTSDQMFKLIGEGSHKANSFGYIENRFYERAVGLVRSSTLLEPTKPDHQ